MYTAYAAIGTGDYYKQIRFVQKNITRIEDLELDEYFEIMLSYRQALFQTCKYEEHIPLSEHLVKLSIQHNIKVFSGEDIYFETLLQKAASHFNLGQLGESLHILRELVRIDPANETARLFLIKGYIREEKLRSRYFFRGLSIACFLLSALVIMLDLLIIHPFFTNYDPIAKYTYQGLFLGGFLILIAGELRLRYRGVGKAINVVRKARKRK